MSDEPVGQMSNDELIAALRKDAAGSGAEHIEAQEEIDRLEAAAKAASMPNAEIRAGLRALWHKFCAPFAH